MMPATFAGRCTDQHSADRPAAWIARCRDFAHAREWRGVLVAIAATLAAGCGASRLDYTPRSDVAKEQAIAVVERALEEQPRQYVPTTVEATPEKIVITQMIVRRRMLFGSVVSSPTTTIYWDNLGDSLLYEKRGRYSVDIVDPDGYLHLRVYLNSERKAHGLIDAIESLRRGSQ